LRDCQVIFVDRIVSLEHCHRFMPGDLHGRESIHTGTSEGCGGGVAMIVEHDIDESSL
jgi:hypothetical protein